MNNIQTLTTTASEILPGNVTDDDHAIRVFLQSYTRNSPHTQRAYARETRRFLLWLHATRTPSPALLPQCTVQDINDYTGFLATPHALPKSLLRTQGWSHTPFRQPLSTGSIKHAILILHRMYEGFRHLRSHGNHPYCTINPVTLARDGVAGTDRTLDEVEQALSEKEWLAVQTAIEALPRISDRDCRHYHRARWLTQLLYRSFLRRDEAAKLTMGAFEQGRDGWDLRVIGKGNKPARIIASTKLMEALREYRLSWNLPPYPTPGETRPAILAITGKDKPVTAQAIYLICKVLFEAAAARLDTEDPATAARLRLASPHWLRHTGISHLMEAGADPRFCQAQARHSSLTVTARYDHKRRDAWRNALEKL